MTTWIRPRTRAAIYARDTPEGMETPCCVYCGRAVEVGRIPSDSDSGKRAAVLDHVFPNLDKKFKNDRRNLVTACWECNADKGERNPAEWEEAAARGEAYLPRWRSRRPEPTDADGQPLSMYDRALQAVARPTCQRRAVSCRRQLADIDAERKANAYAQRRRNWRART